MQVATCVSNGNERTIVKALTTLKANVRRLVEDVNKVCYAPFYVFCLVTGLIGKYCGIL